MTRIEMKIILDFNDAEKHAGKELKDMDGRKLAYFLEHAINLGWIPAKEQITHDDPDFLSPVETELFEYGAETEVSEAEDC